MIGMLCNTAAAKMSLEPTLGRSAEVTAHAHTYTHARVCCWRRINPMVISENMTEKPIKLDRLQPLGAPRKTKRLSACREKTLARFNATTNT